METCRQVQGRLQEKQIESEDLQTTLAKIRNESLQKIEVRQSVNRCGWHVVWCTFSYCCIFCIDNHTHYFVSFFISSSLIYLFEWMNEWTFVWMHLSMLYESCCDEIMESKCPVWLVSWILYPRPLPPPPLHISSSSYRQQQAGPHSSVIYQALELSI